MALERAAAGAPFSFFSSSCFYVSSTLIDNSFSSCCSRPRVCVYHSMASLSNELNVIVISARAVHDDREARLFCQKSFGTCARARAP
jgi:hypothetical protein